MSAAQEARGTDAGSALDCPPADQRGAGRVGACDIGAFEFVPCPDLVLSGEIVSGTETRANCQAIVVGPDFSVADPGNLTLRAGRKVALGNTTSVGSGGRLTIELEPDLQLGSGPVAAFEFSILPDNRTVVFTFTGAGSEPLSFEWDFERDGFVNSTARNPTFVYPTAGVNLVELTVANAFGWDSAVRTI